MKNQLDGSSRTHLTHPKTNRSKQKSQSQIKHHAIHEIYGHSTRLELRKKTKCAGTRDPTLTLWSESEPREGATRETRRRNTTTAAEEEYGIAKTGGRSDLRKTETVVKCVRPMTKLDDLFQFGLYCIFTVQFQLSRFSAARDRESERPREKERAQCSSAEIVSVSICRDFWITENKKSSELV